MAPQALQVARSESLTALNEDKYVNGDTEDEIEASDLIYTAVGQYGW